MKKSVNKGIAIALSLIQVILLLSGCGAKEEVIIDPVVVPVESDEAVESINDVAPVDTAMLEEDISHEIAYVISNDWEDYKGDVETFVYGLIMNQLQYEYDVFPACVDLSNGMSVSGVGYTNYSECYLNADETKSFFSAGFIPGIGEIEIPEEDFRDGLEMENLEYTDEKAGFVLKYQSDEYAEHCVVYDQYVTYGVNEAGVMFCEWEKNAEDAYDESLGSLYSYDRSRYIYDVDLDVPHTASGESLVTQIDYASLEAGINEILKTQNANFAALDIETRVHFAQESLNNYLLSLQEEKFLGYDVSSLVELASELDPMECYQMTSDGLMTMELAYATEDEVARWLVGSACVITIATGLVAAAVTMECPTLSGAAGAITGSAIEIFMQVVIQNQKVADVEWNKVAIAACSGAISGICGPYIAATYSEWAYFIADSVLDGLIGGAEQSIYAWMDGKDGVEMVKSAGFGFALGCGLSAGLKLIGTAAGTAASKVTPEIRKLEKRVFPKLTAKVSDLTVEIGSALGVLKEAADSTVFHSKYISKKLGLKQVAQFAKNGSEELKTKSFANLKKDDLLDVHGNTISKSTLEDIFDEADDNTVIGFIKHGEETISIKKQNGMVGIEFDESKYLTVELPNGMKPDRQSNFREAVKEMRKTWENDPGTMPETLAAALRQQGLELEDATDDGLVSIIQTKSNGLVLHENIDMKTVTLVPRELHDTSVGGVAHMGGCSLAQYVKNHMGQLYFDRYVAAAATGLVVAQ